MPSDNLIEHTCPGCGAKLAPRLRYCLYCYRPTTDKSVAKAHTESARQVSTTRRVDPTVVFLPEEHDAMIARSRRRRRALIVAAVAFVALIIGSTTVHLINRRAAETRRAMAREQMARRELALLGEALERFKADLGRYPTTEEGIKSLTRKPVPVSAEGRARAFNWFGPYMDGVYEVDPWGNDYVYQVTDDGRAFELFSYGPQGEAGGETRLQVSSPPPSW
jgi:general secretion pathway protein G